jgi:hypothetical protein
LTGQGSLNFARSRKEEDFMNSKWVRVILIAVLCIVVFCFIATTSQIITIGELPANFIAVFLEAAVTAVITVVLLTGQSSAEEVKERNVKVFEKKSEIFQDYINIVWDIWQDHTVDSEEYLKLTSKYYKELMLYLNKKSTESIGRQLQKIGGLIGAENQEQNKSILQGCLIEIINTLSDEISLGGHVDMEIFKDLDTKMEDARTRSQRTTFKMLGIKKGTELVCKTDSSITCITKDETNKVLFHDETRSISNVAMELNNGRAANGFDWFMLNGKTLWEMRKKIENN